MNNWLRLWHDMPNDPKWRTISKASQTSISDVIAVYIHLLVEASANAHERGRTHTNSIEHIASALDMETGFVTRIIEAMQGRVLEGTRLMGWEKRQPIREDGSAERAKAWREKKEAERNRTQPNANEPKRRGDKEESISKPPTPKGDEVGEKNFEEIWSARWGRGEASNPRAPALKSYLSAIKCGVPHETILASVKARHGVDKADTPYAPQMVTWLNQERWKDTSGKAPMSPDELAAWKERLNASRADADARMEAARQRKIA